MTLGVAQGPRQSVRRHCDPALMLQGSMAFLKFFRTRNKAQHANAPVAFEEALSFSLSCSDESVDVVTTSLFFIT